MEGNISTSTSTVRSLHQNISEINTCLTSNNGSVPSSPRSSALPSPPDSPSSDVSSLPSVSSSFFFSSSAASPGYSRPHSDHGRDTTEALIIPSLTMPPALCRPTPYGQTLGELRLLVLGSQGAGKSFLMGLLLEDNEDVVEVGTWEDAEYGKVLRASTDWIEHKDNHGLEKFEPTRNVEIVELPGYNYHNDGHELITNIKTIIHSPFNAVSDVLHPDQQPSAVVANLISSASTPLYTALVFLLPSAPTVLDQLIIDNLGNEIPIIVLPRLRDSGSAKLSAFRPANAVALRAGLFHSPETLTLLRTEAADRFLRWREVERSVDHVHQAQRERDVHREKQRWDKAKWESEWMATLSQDVSRRVREGTITERDIKRPQPQRTERSVSSSRPYANSPPFDPLHLPSLLMFSVSLLDPLRSRIESTFSEFWDALGKFHLRFALIGGFCVGVGVGFFVR